MADPAREMRVQVPPDHPAFDGHFPGHPVLPGVVLLAQAQEAVLADPDVAPWFRAGLAVQAVKFLASAGPGMALAFRWTLDAPRRRVQVQVWRFAPEDGSAGVLACTAHLEAAAP